MENIKRELTGKVVSVKNDKTITVLVETYIMDKKYVKELCTLKNMLLMMRKMKQMLAT